MKCNLKCRCGVYASGLKDQHSWNALIAARICYRVGNGIVTPIYRTATVHELNVAIQIQ